MGAQQQNQPRQREHPACGTHNRIKQRGFHTWRQPDGYWRITAPDGTPVPDALTHWPEHHEPHPQPGGSDDGRTEAA
ncbi:MAG: hypothetical protein R2695_16650 [Acidimicrobiales bacterium]